MCGVDEATQKHHVKPRSKGGRKLETVDCCSDCGGQVHMLYTNHDLATRTFDEIINHTKMDEYIKWKKTHPGTHKHRMSNEVKVWRTGHR
jgi:hypothetical protein